MAHTFSNNPNGSVGGDDEDDNDFRLEQLDAQPHSTPYSRRSRSQSKSPS